MVEIRKQYQDGDIQCICIMDRITFRKLNETNMGTRTLILSLFVFLFAGCSVHQNVKQVDPCGSYILLYEDNPLSSPRLTILEDGTFCLEQENHGLYLNEVKAKQKGIWTREGNCIFLTSNFQDEVRNFIALQGDYESSDSIQIICMSMSDELICNDGFLLFVDTAVYMSDSNGILCFPCELGRDVAKALLESTYLEEILQHSINLDELLDTGILRCGKRYLFYIRDCSVWKMTNEKFEIRDSCLHNVQYDEDYRRVRSTQQPNR